MFERFTDRARRVLVLAQEESRLRRHGRIGPEHILMGLLGEGGGIAGQVLRSLGISTAVARERLVASVGEGEAVTDGAPPFTAAAKRVLEQSLREALQLRVNYIGTEHMLLGLVDEDSGVAVDLLAALGVERDRVRQAVLKRLSGMDALPNIDADDVTVTDSSPDPSDLLTQDDVEDAWRQHPLDPVVATGARQAAGVVYRWISFDGRMPTAWLAVAEAEISSDVFDSVSGALDPADVAPVEGIGDRACFDTQAMALRVLSGSTLFVITVTGAKDRSLDLATALARKVLARLGP